MPTVNGTPEDDELFPLLNQDTEIKGQGGNDTLFAGAGQETLDGGTGVDWAYYTTKLNGLAVFVGGVTASLQSGEATMIIDGTEVRHALRDIENLRGSEFSDGLTGDDGNNEFQGFAGNDTIMGLGGDDVIFSGAGNDLVDGGSGADSLFAMSGNATLDGGADEDWAFFSTTAGGSNIYVSGVAADLGTGEATGQVGAFAYLYALQNIENLGGSAAPDKLVGNDDGNMIRGLAGDDAISGAGGDDTLKGGQGDDSITGGAGTDVAEYDGAGHRFTVRYSFDTQETVVFDRSGQEGRDIVDTNMLRFPDRDVTVTVDGSLYFDDVILEKASFTELVELYIAYFNRAPDAVGLNFWTRAFINGTDLDEAAAFFFDQPETRALYGNTIDPPVFVTAVYQNVLGRGPDDVGLGFWVDALSSGAVTEGQFIRDFLQGTRAVPPDDADPVFVDQQNLDRAYLDTKTDIGVSFGVVRGMSNTEQANAVMSLFDGSDASLEAARMAIEEAYTAAQATNGTGELLIQMVGLLEDPFTNIVG